MKNLITSIGATTLFSGLITIITSASVQGQVLFRHFGTNDPVAFEGWNQVGTGASVGPIDDSGTPAWSADDTSHDDGSFAFYIQPVTNDQITQANTLGWSLTVRVRVVRPGSFPSAPFAGFSNGTKEYQMNFGAEPNGDPIVSLHTGSAQGLTFKLDGEGGGYHLYSLVYDPVVASVDLCVDGIKRITNYAGFSRSGCFVDWGAGSSPGVGNANFNLFEFTVVPKPSISIRSSQVEICWSSRINVKYNVQYRSDLTAGAWVNLFTNIEGTGTSNCVLDAVPRGEPQRYYQVQVAQ